MAVDSNEREKQAVIVIAVLGALVMIAGLVGFAIWDRPSADLPQLPKAAVNAPPPIASAPNPPPQGTTNRGAKPRGNPGTWVTPNDYPGRALQEEREGTTGFRLNISADGRPLFCSITKSSGHSDLDVATCKALMRRARFNPALDASGKPVVSVYSSRVRWQIPRE